MTNSKPTCLSSEDKKQVSLIAQEISLVKILGSNEKRLRQKGIKRLGKWLKIKSDSLSRDDLLRLWKGLYCCMWMTDKPLIQEEVADAMGKLIHNIHSEEGAACFVGSFFDTMAAEWYGIDQLRLDKFMMLLRRVLRQAFMYCHKRDWSQDIVEHMCKEFSNSVLTNGKPLGLVMHFSDVYLEEFAKVTKGKVSCETVTRLLEPFIVFLSVDKDGRLTSHVTKHVFHYLMVQSDLGQEYQAKFDAWIMAGCPGDSWKDMERVDDDDEENDIDSDQDYEGDATDPRAGQLDVVLRPIPFDSGRIAQLLKSQRDNTFEVKNRRVLLKLLEQFKKMSEGDYPLAENLKDVSQIRENLKRRHHTKKALRQLVKFDSKLMENDKQKKKRRKPKKGQKDTSIVNENESESDMEMSS